MTSNVIFEMLADVKPSGLHVSMVGQGSLVVLWHVSAPMHHSITEVAAGPALASQNIQGFSSEVRCMYIGARTSFKMGMRE